MNTSICDGQSSLLPESDHRFLLLLNTGQFEEEKCYQDYLEKQRQLPKAKYGYPDLIVSPVKTEGSQESETNNWFPYPIARIKVGPQTDLNKLEQYRKKQLNELIKNPLSMVLLTCGHYLQLDCWNHYRRQEHLSCPYDSEHRFPIVTDLLTIDRFMDDSTSPEDTWLKMVEYRRARLSNKSVWAYEAFHFSGRLLPLQIRFSQELIQANYHELFQTNYYDGILTLRQEYDLNRVLEWTVHNSEPELVKKVLPYVNTKNLFNYIDTRINLFHLACLIGNSEVITALIEGLPNEYQIKLVNSKNFMNLNGLFYVTRQNHFQVCRYLLNKGIDVNILDGYSGRTPLIYAIERVNLPMVALILASERVNLGYNWTIKTGLKSSQLTSYAYHQLPRYYLGEPNTNEEKRFLDAFEGIFNLTSSGLNFHFVDKEDTQIVTLKQILQNPRLSYRSSLPNDFLSDLLDNLEISNSYEDNQEDLYRKELCSQISSLDWDVYQQNLIPLFETYDIICLLTEKPFTSTDQIISSHKKSFGSTESPYNLLPHGFVYRQPPIDVGFNLSQTTGKWIIDGQSQYLLSFLGRVFTSSIPEALEQLPSTTELVLEVGEEED